jgi:nucleoside-diphosphate-sugar epimerase
MIKKAIVTGATGFVGSNLCRKLIKQNWQVSIIVRKSSNYSNIEDIKNKLNIFEYNGKTTDLMSFFKNDGYNVVFHLASLVIVEHESWQINDLVDSNLKFGLNILEAMKKSNTKLIINTGTSWQHYHNNEYNPVNLYAATKEAYENILKYYTEAEGIRAITLKLFDTYGETDKRPKLINLLNQFADEQKELIMSPGEQVINLVHVDDVTNAFIKAFDYLIENKQVKNKIFGVSSQEDISLKELIPIFENLTGEKLNIVWGGREYRKREVMKLWNDYETLPNWKCNIKLEEGLRKYNKKNKK